MEKMQQAVDEYFTDESARDHPDNDVSQNSTLISFDIPATISESLIEDDAPQDYNGEETETTYELMRDGSHRKRQVSQ